VNASGLPTPFEDRRLNGKQLFRWIVVVVELESHSPFLCVSIVSEIGGALSEYYPHCRPNMEDYDVHVRADVVGTCIVLGTQLNVHDLSKERHFLRYRNAVTLKVRFLEEDKRLFGFDADFDYFV
jgi:hypothetical protein